MKRSAELNLFFKVNGHADPHTHAQEVTSCHHRVTRRQLYDREVRRHNHNATAAASSLHVLGEDFTAHCGRVYGKHVIPCGAKCGSTSTVVAIATWGSQRCTAAGTAAHKRALDKALRSHLAALIRIAQGAYELANQERYAHVLEPD